MDMVKHLLFLLESQSLITHQWGMTNVRPLHKNSGIMFRVNGNRLNGLVKIRLCPLNKKYIITFIPYGRGVVTEKRSVEEEDIVNVISKEVGQAPFVLDFLIDVYLI